MDQVETSGDDCSDTHYSLNFDTKKQHCPGTENGGMDEWHGAVLFGALKEI